MGKVSKYTMAKSWASGKESEALFVSIMEARGATVVKSSRHEDINLHIDFYVNGHGVDVKSGRTMDKIWLEVTNVRGDDGWLKGSAEFIAFHFDDKPCFMFFRRDDLLDFVQANVIESTDSNKEYMKWYTRSDWDRKDLIAKVKYDHIKHIKHTIINC
jgi:hypothetical protein